MKHDEAGTESGGVIYRPDGSYTYARAGNVDPNQPRKSGSAMNKVYGGLVFLTIALTYVKFVFERESTHIPLIGGVVLLVIVGLMHVGADAAKTQSEAKEFFERENAKARADAASTNEGGTS